MIPESLQSLSFSLSFIFRSYQSGSPKWTGRNGLWLHALFLFIFWRKQNCWISLPSWPQTRSKKTQKNCKKARHVLLAHICDIFGAMLKNWLQKPDCKMADFLVFLPNKSRKHKKGSIIAAYFHMRILIRNFSAWKIDTRTGDDLNSDNWKQGRR